MEVICDNCRTEYDLDESRIPETGLPVKCTTCGRLFRVYKPQKTEVPQPLPFKPVALAEAPAVAPYPPARDAEPVAEAKASPPPALQESSQPQTQWILKRFIDNQVFYFSDLPMLRQWITERRALRDDEISRTGDIWKRLGDIAELEPLFSALDAAASHAGAPEAAAQPHDYALFGPEAAPYGAHAPEAAPAELRAAPLVEPGEVSAADILGPAEPAREESSSAEPAAQEPARPAEPPADHAAEPAAPQPALVAPSVPAHPSWLEPTLPQGMVQTPDMTATVPMEVFRPAQEAPDAKVAPVHAPAPLTASARRKEETPKEEESWEEDQEVAFKRRGKLKWVILAVIVLVIAGAGLKFAAPDLFSSLLGKMSGKEIDPEAKRFLDSAYKHFKRDSIKEFELAESELNKALAAEKSDPARAKFLLSIVYSAWSRYLFEDIDDLQQQLSRISQDGGDNAPQKAREFGAKINQTSLVAGDKKKLAFDNAKAAISDGSSRPDMNLAMAFYYASQKDGKYNISFKKTLQTAKPALPENDALLNYVEGIGNLFIEGTVETAVHYLKKAVESDADMLAARCDLAKALKQQKLDDEAEREAKRLLEANPDHERAAALQKAWSGAPQPLEPAPPQPPQPPPEETVKKQNEKKPEKAVHKTKEHGDGSSLLRQADSLRDKGKCAQAVKLYEKAAATNATSARAHMGLGWCFYEDGNYQKAIQSFEKAYRSNTKLYEAIIGLGETNKMAGKKTEAIKYYQLYLEVAPDGPDANLARNNLARLK